MAVFALPAHTSSYFPIYFKGQESPPPTPTPTPTPEILGLLPGELPTAGSFQQATFFAVKKKGWPVCELVAEGMRGWDMLVTRSA